MRKLLFAAGVALLAVCAVPQDASALGLKIAPLSYEAELQKGETKKGFVDISNPYSTPVQVKLEAQAFRQIDDEGSLEFFASEQITQGVRLDYNTITIGAREAYRVYFLLDGTKLGEGDSFAAIFASTVPKAQAGSAQSVRVGTILTIQNGTPVEHRADVVGFVAAWLQTGEGLRATLNVKNPSDPKEATGFYPTIRMATVPYGGRDVEGPLIFAGRTRSVEYSQPGNYFGPLWLSASVNESSKGQLILAVTGYWRWLAPILAVVFLTIIFILRRSGILRRKRKH